MPDSKSISSAYRRAGEDFLAYRLEKMFRKIETPADIALHNDVLAEAMLIIDDNPKVFFQTLAHKMLLAEGKTLVREDEYDQLIAQLNEARQQMGRDSFVKKVAESIMSVSKG